MQHRVTNRTKMIINDLTTTTTTVVIKEQEVQLVTVELGKQAFYFFITIQMKATLEIQRKG